MKKQKTNIEDLMWKQAPQASFIKAKHLRLLATKAEKILWEKLRNHRLDGVKFRQQHPIGLYIVDFYCHGFKLVIELDGDYHFTEEQQSKDHERTVYLNSNGIRVIRFTNQQIEEKINEVMEIIRETLLEIKPTMTIAESMLKSPFL